MEEEEGGRKAGEELRSMGRKWAAVKGLQSSASIVKKPMGCTPSHLGMRLMPDPPVVGHGGDVKGRSLRWPQHVAGCSINYLLH